MKILGEEKRENKQSSLPEAAVTMSNLGFLAEMGHELRTPLNTIIGFSDILLEGLGGPLTRKQSEYIKIINESGHDLLGLINDILELSRLEAGDVVLENIKFDLLAMLRKSCAEIRNGAVEAGVVPEIEISPKVPSTISGDEQVMSKAVMYLLSRAVNVAPPGSSAKMTADIRSDSGGYSPVPGRFLEINVCYSSDVNEKKVLGDTDLKLSLARKIAALLGGNIWLENRAGEGLVICLTVSVECCYDENACCLEAHTQTS